MGWKLVGNMPTDVKKAVLVCAPHTSNWDFPLALASFQVARLNLKYFIKKSWFFFPMNLFFRATGGVPVNRSKNVGLVEAMALQLKNADEMILAVPAEGTRSWVPKWKTGFYYVAKAANVPILTISAKVPSGIKPAINEMISPQKTITFTGVLVFLFTSDKA